MKTTEERMVEAVTPLFRRDMGFQIGPAIAYEPRDAEAFLCRELDDIRGQLARALGQLGMMGLPEPPAEGVHVHTKVFSGVVLTSYPPQRKWICSECLEEGTDSERVKPKGPSYEELVAKKRSAG